MKKAKKAQDGAIFKALLHGPLGHGFKSLTAYFFGHHVTQIMNE